MSSSNFANKKFCDKSYIIQTTPWNIAFFVSATKVTSNASRSYADTRNPGNLTSPLKTLPNTKFTGDYAIMLHYDFKDVMFFCWQTVVMSNKLLWTNNCPAQTKLEELFKNKNEMLMKKQYPAVLSAYKEFHGFTLSQFEKHAKTTATKLGFHRK